MLFTFNCSQVPEWLNANLQAFSGSFSHYFLWRGFRVMFDCGEGAGIRLDDHVFRVDVLALSHGHSDHCRGLTGFLESRAFIKGANEKPLKIVFPGDSPMMRTWIDSGRISLGSPTEGDAISHSGIGRTPKEQTSRLAARLDVEFCPVIPGATVELRSGRVLQATAVEHVKGESCAAYRVGKKRSRLKAEFSGLPSKEIATLKKQMQPAEFQEDYFECELVYSGDCIGLPAGFAADAHALIHEATFLRAEDADTEKGIHSTVESALNCAVKEKARNVILFHSSRRYSDLELRQGVESMLKHVGYAEPVFLVRGSFGLPVD